MQKNLLENLINNGIELPFYKNLSKFIELPNNLEDKQILLYIANNSQRPILYSRTLKEEEFKQDEFINIYRNMYVKTKMLFDDELWEYQIFDEANNLLSTGNISNLINNKKIYDSNSNSRFDLINEIINEKEEDKVKVLIEDFILKDIFTNKIFDLM